MDNAQKIKLFKDWFRTCADHPGWRSWRNEAPIDRAYYDSDQLSEQERAELEERGQPPIVVNMIFAKLNSLRGAQRIMRSGIGVLPRKSASEKIAQALKDYFRYIQQTSDYQFEESDQFDDAISQGIGWIEAFIQEDEAGQMSVDIDHENNWLILLDPLSVKYDLSDARFIIRHRWMDLDDAIEMFPKFEKELCGQVNAADSIMSSSVARGPLDDYDLWAHPTTHEVPFVDTRRRRVRIAEVWYRETQTLMFKDGQHYVSKKDFATMRDGAKPDNQIMAEQNITKRKMKAMRLAMFCGDTLMQDDITPYNNILNINKFPFFPLFCFRKRNGEPYGYVRPARSVQDEINKRRSKALHILNTKQVIADANAFEDIEEARDEIARPDGMILKRSGSDVKIESNINLANTQFNIMNQSGSDLQSILGIFDEAIGRETNARSGYAIQARKNSANQNNVSIFDNQRRTKLLLGRFIFGLMKQYITDEQVFFITDETSGQGREVTLKGMDIREALVDIVIDELELNPTAQDEQFMYLAELAKSGYPLPPAAIIQASRLRNKEELLKGLQPAAVPEGAAPMMETPAQGGGN